MIKTLFELPVTSSHFVKGPRLRKLAGHDWGLFWTVESENGSEREQGLTFGEVQSFRCTFRGAIATESITSAYDRVVELSQSDYLKSLQSTMAGSSHTHSGDLKHMAIYFDDGPYYEFIAAKYSFVE